jgi:hypothetical protein
MLLAGLVYGGFSLFLVGCASLVRPLVGSASAIEAAPCWFLSQACCS